MNILNVKCIFISPSGNFYGSEQVLFDYLNSTKISNQLYLPKDSIFEKKITEINGKKSNLRGFRSLKFLYLNLFFKLFFKKANSIYLNEAGHIRYIKILAKFFPKVNFIVHIRLIEDTSFSRLHTNNTNIQYVAISQYIFQALPVKSKLIYDPFPFNNIKQNIKSNGGKIKVGVIGRISKNKGLDKLIQLAISIENNPLFFDFEFNLYGDQIFSEENNEFLNLIPSLKMLKPMGFVLDKTRIYQDIDVVLHLCEVEPLGRIFLEAINFGIPFIGFNAGGIGEIGKLTCSSKLLVIINDNWINEIQSNLLLVKNNQSEILKGMEKSKELAMELFSLENYTNEMDKLIIEGCN
jgi:glycosyltransferase involved in cell wall biosynthesis